MLFEESTKSNTLVFTGVLQIKFENIKLKERELELKENYLNTWFVLNYQHQY